MGRKEVAHNKKAGFDIAVTDHFEAGLVLTGDEIKSIREGRAQITGGYIKLLRGSGSVIPVVLGIHLSKAAEPERSRTLLLHKRELRQLEELLSVKGRTAVALRLYLERGWAKVTIGVGTGRKQRDKREVLKQRDLDRQQHSDLKGAARR